MKSLALLCLLSGCEIRWWEGNVDYSPMPNQDEAVGLVWGFYQAEPNPVPVIGWMTYTNCGAVNGDPGFIDYENICVTGEYVPADGLILLAKRNKIYESSLAHELAHAASQVLYHDPDADHVSNYFSNGGSVDQANKLLYEQDY